MTGAAFGQANLVTFSPSHSTIVAETNATVYSPLFGGGNTGGGSLATTATPATSGGLNFDYELLYQTQSGYQVLATDTHVWDGTWTDSGLSATNSNSFAGQGALASVGPTATSVAWNNPTTNSIVLVGWSTDLGSTWAGVSNILAALALGNTAPLVAADPSGAEAFFGESSFGYIQPTVSPASGAGIFGTSAGPNGLPIGNPAGSDMILYLLPVPEPTTMALAGLGGLAMLLFRRQRK